MEFIKKDNIFIHKFQHDEYIHVQWYNSESNNEFYNRCAYYMTYGIGENITYSKVEKNEVENEMFGSSWNQLYFSDIRYFDNVQLDSNNFINKLKKIVFSPVVYTKEYDGKECYYYNIYSFTNYYVDKETLLPIASEGFYNGKPIIVQSIEYEFDYDENILQEPNINDFETADYMDTDYYDCDNYKQKVNENKYSEKSISGTSLLPTDTLIENVELKENENLDLLKLKENSFGIKQARIDYLETYDKFREKYSNLRELTLDDFEYYYVIIAYKKGYELNYLSSVECQQSYTLNYVCDEKKSDKDNLLLIVAPRVEKNSANIIITNEEIKITAQEAYETYFENEDLIKENINLNKDEDFAWGYDILDKLTNDDYKKLNYVKTSIQENENPICWVIADNNFRNGTAKIKTYIDAISGELIGTMYNK